MTTGLECSLPLGWICGPSLVCHLPDGEEPSELELFMHLASQLLFGKH